MCYSLVQINNNYLQHNIDIFILTESEVRAAMVHGRTDNVRDSTLAHVTH